MTEEKDEKKKDKDEWTEEKKGEKQREWDTGKKKRGEG